MLSEVVDYYAHQRTRQSLATTIVFALAFDPTCTYIASGTTSGMLTVHSLSTAVVTDHMDTEGRAIDSNSNRNYNSHYSSPPSSIVAQHNLARHGSINALCTCGDALFIATDRGGVLCVTWDNIINNNLHHMHDHSVISRVYPTSTEEQERQQQQQHHQLHHPCQVNALTACADGESIVAAFDDGKLVRIHAGSAAVSAVVSSSSSSGNNKINGMPGHQVNHVDGHVDPYPHTVAASPVDRHCVITGCNDGSVRQYDFRRSKGFVRKVYTSPSTVPSSPLPRRSPSSAQVSTLTSGTVSASASASASTSTPSKQVRFSLNTSIISNSNSPSQPSSTPYTKTPSPALSSSYSPSLPRTPPPPDTQPHRPSVYVPTVAFHPDGMYAMVGTSDRQLSALHFGSASTIKTVPLPFVPQSMTISGQSTFYVGGSDRYGGVHSSSVGTSTLQAFDVLCNPLPAAPVSAGSVYATAAAASSGGAYDGGHSSPHRSVVAAAGFTPTTDFNSPWQTQRRIDVYLDPPIRSFSLSI